MDENKRKVLAAELDKGLKTEALTSRMNRLNWLACYPLCPSR